MNNDTPVIFADGSDVYDRLKDEYIVHSEGRFILAASGTGKSYYINGQSEKHWIDGDHFWPLTNADLSPGEWGHDLEVIMEINNRCDVMTYQAKKQGLWLIGSSNNWLKPDAIVILDETTHLKYIKERQNGDYDGGATEDDFEAVKRHNEFIKKWAEEGVPQFSSIQDATLHFIDLESNP